MDIERIALEQGREVEREANRLRQVQKTLRLLPKVLQVPSIPDPLTNAIQSLSLDAIDRLSEDLLDFHGLEDLVNWLLSPELAEQDLLLPILTDRLGNFSTNLQAQIQALSPQQRQTLAQHLLTWNSLQDLQAWLANNL
jgi:hypothetical protein